MIPGQYVYVANSNGDFLPQPRKLLAVLDEPYHGCKYIVASSAEAGGVRVFPIAKDVNEGVVILAGRTFKGLGNITEMKLKIDFKTPEQQYVKKQEESGLKVVDYVRVTRKAANRENGWDNAWIPYNMDSAVGKVFKIENINGEEGIRLSDKTTMQYPYFVLEKTCQQAYLRQQTNVSDLKPGDWVKVTRKWDGDECSLPEFKAAKEAMVGKAFKIRKKYDWYFCLETGDEFNNSFPVFVLEKTDPPKVHPTKADVGKEVFVVNTTYPSVKRTLHAIVNNYAVVDSAYAGGTPVIYPLKEVFLA